MVIPSSSKISEEIEEDIWGSVLRGVRKGSNDTERGTLIVLGDVNSGKTALLARARGDDIPTLKKGVALNYDFMNVYEDHIEEPVGDVDIWILEGEIMHRDLLRASLNEDALNNCVAMICLDFMQPWLMVETLNKWLDFLRKLLAEVRTESSDKKGEEQLIQYLQNYTEPAEDAKTKSKKKKRAPIVITDEHLGDQNIVKFNLGIPIVIVCCKSDTAMLLEKDYEMRTHIFEVVQVYLRQICVNYGASLIFTSAKKDINTELLMDYIEHRLFGMEFNYRANILENDSVFVPAGWDNIGKVQSDAKNMHVDLSEPFETVVKKPSSKRGTQVPVIIAEDDIPFLERHKSVLDQEDEFLRGGGWRTPAAATPSPLSLLTAKQPLSSTSPFSSTTSSSSSSFTTPSSQLQPRASATPVAEDLSHSPVLGPTKTRAPVDNSFVSPSAKDKHVLASFFDALMKSKDAKRPDPTSPLGRGLPQARQDVEKELERLKNTMKKQ